jgi:hypothetical protein
MTEIIIPLNGHVRIRAWEKQEDGSEIQIHDQTIKNLIVDAGKESILKGLGNLGGGGYANEIGVGDDSTTAASGQTDLQASTNKLWVTIAIADRVFINNTLYISADFGYTQGNWTWNELGLRDSQGTPVMWARQTDSTPLVKTTTKRAIVEWQLSL